MRTDRELLELYVNQRDEQAFGELVRRHTDMVYGACLRVLRRPDAAEDAAQAAFLVLVRRARPVLGCVSISGWLFRTAVRCALNLQRISARRIRHEREAENVASGTDVQKAPDADRDWTELSAHLDAALLSLPEVQREAIVLRCLQGRTQAEAAVLLGCPGETVHTRVSRGLEKLRVWLTRRDVRLSASALALLLGLFAQESAPKQLASSIQAACLGKAAATETAAALAKEVLLKMVWTKIAVVTAGMGLAAACVLFSLRAASPAPAPRPAAMLPQRVAGQAQVMVIADPAPLAAPKVPRASPAWPASAPGKKLSKQIGAAIDGGLGWLASAQEADGHFDSKRFGGGADQDVAVTALATVSFLGAGHTENVGLYKATVLKSLEWLRTQHPAAVTQNALRVLTLAEGSGMSNHGRPEAQAALDEFLAMQSLTGEWTDEAASGDYARTIEPTSWAVCALKSSKVAGLKVPGEAIDRAISTFDRQQAAVTTHAGSLAGAKMAAALAVERQFMGWRAGDPQVVENVQALAQQPPTFPAAGIGHEVILWWQGQLAEFQQGGQGWNDWSGALRSALLPSQVQDGEFKGSWDFRSGSDPFIWGRVGATALASLCIEVEFRYIALTSGAPAPAQPRTNNTPPAAPLPLPGTGTADF